MQFCKNIHLLRNQPWMEHLSGTVRGVVKAAPGGLAIAAIAVAFSDVVADVACCC